MIKLLTRILKTLYAKSSFYKLTKFSKYTKVSLFIYMSNTHFYSLAILLLIDLIY